MKYYSIQHYRKIILQEKRKTGMVAQVYKYSSIWEYRMVKLQAQGQAELYKKEKHYLKHF